MVLAMPVPPLPFQRLAFVDVETTGLGADHHRIAEVGVVTVDDGNVADAWDALLDPGRRIADLPHEFGAEPPYFCADRASELPRFRDIARALAARLDGRLVVAHNARFDYAYLKAEFERAGIGFAPQVVCSVMLSRRLYPAVDAHDLDALCARFGIAVDVRHRALPDARLLQQAWAAIARDVGAKRFAKAVAALLAEPLLPPQLDLGLIDALPERAGVFAFLDVDDRPLLIGRAANLRRHVKRYFHADRDCARADAIAGRLARIRHEPASGPLDARLRELGLRDALGLARKGLQSALSIAVDPAAVPAATIVALRERNAAERDLYGLFATERMAKNALARIAARDGVCAAYAGLAPAGACDCARDGTAPPDVLHAHDPRNLMRLVAGLSPLRLQSWPFAGPIAIRERRTVHVFDRWEHLGSVRSGSDVHAALQQRRRGFDPRVYGLLVLALPRVPRRSLQVLATAAQRPPRDAELRATTIASGEPC
jgi:DNA polymerase-3 subunit epsilon